MFFLDVMVFFLLFQGIEIGIELVVWGLIKGVEVGSYLMYKVVLCVLLYFFIYVVVYKVREQVQLYFVLEKFFGVVRCYVLLIKNQLYWRLLQFSIIFVFLVFSLDFEYYINYKFMNYIL